MKVQVFISYYEMIEYDGDPQNFIIEKLREARIPVSLLTGEPQSGVLYDFDDTLNNYAIYTWEGNQIDILPLSEKVV